MTSIKAILLPTDFSTCSEQAFHFACSLARDLQARLLVLHVIQRPVVAYGGVAMAPPPSPPSAAERDEARQKLEQLKPASAGLVVHHFLEEGDPKTAILQVAQEQKCDLIVIGSHGRTGLARLLMGSVAEQVVRLAECPVCIVKMQNDGSTPSV